MLTQIGRSPRYCDGVSRRNFLQIGAASVAGLSMADMLRADELHKTSSGYSKKSFINIYLAGGPSHIDTFDPKPEAPSEIRGEFAPINTSVSGIQISEHLPQVAHLMHKFAIVRSITGVVDEHNPRQTESGWSENSMRSIGGRPSLGSVVAKIHGPNNGSAPTFVDMSSVSNPGFLGSVYSAYKPDGEGRSNLTLQGVTVDRLGDRQKLLAGLDRLKRESDIGTSMKAMDSFTERAVNVITSGRVANALNLDKEDPRTRARYNGNENNRENDRFIIARRLVEVGVRCVSFAWGGWDTHSNNFGHLKMQLPKMDVALAALVEDLEARGMSDDVVIAVWGEFGRTPRVNGTAGRDHWPRAMSVLLSGGGMQMGQVIGSTNRMGEVAKDRPVHLQEVFATLYQHMGIDAKHTTMIDNNGRPQYVVEHPTPVRELLGRNVNVAGT